MRSGQPRCGDAQERQPALEEDRLAAVPLEERLAALEERLRADASNRPGARAGGERRAGRARKPMLSPMIAASAATAITIEQPELSTRREDRGGDQRRLSRAAGCRPIRRR